MIWHGFGEATSPNSTNIWLNEAEKSLLYNISDGTWSLQHNEVIASVISPKKFASTILGTYETLGLYQVNDLNLYDFQDLTSDTFIYLVVRICH